MADKTAIDDALTAIIESTDPDELTKVIRYKDDHWCEPNGVGDYRFVCPKNGIQGGFIPFFERTRIRGKCSCGSQIELSI